MPFYEYVCTECHAQTELLQKISDPPATECPRCHANALTKVVSAAGFRLRGGGWYETDFKASNKKNLAGAESSSPSTGADAGKTAGDGKSSAPAATPAPAPAKSSSDT